jgi:dihydrofolate reductase
MHISFIAAMSENHVIGKEGALPWHLPNDLKHFKKLTLGKNILMGRKTFESIKRPLPERNNFVLTKDPSFVKENVTVFYSKDEVVNSGIDEFIVIGGADIYQLFFGECEKIYLTVVHAVVEGDVYFPQFSHFNERAREDYAADANHAYPYSFLELVRSKR